MPAIIVKDKDHEVEYGIRAYQKPADDPAIFATWCNHIRKLEPFNTFSGAQFRSHRILMEQLVDRCGAILAYDHESPKDANQIFGWICGEYFDQTPVLHFIYVRAPFRQFGIGTRLMTYQFPMLKSEVIECSHPGRSLPHLRNKWLLHYNPYLVLKPPLLEAS